jgi:hypothetical protein
MCRKLGLVTIHLHSIFIIKVQAEWFTAFDLHRIFYTASPNFRLMFRKHR